VPAGCQPYPPGTGQAATGSFRAPGCFPSPVPHRALGTFRRFPKVGRLPVGDQKSLPCLNAIQAGEGSTEEKGSIELGYVGWALGQCDRYLEGAAVSQDGEINFLAGLVSADLASQLIE